MHHPSRLAPLLLVVTACGFPRPPSVADDAGAIPIDANIPPGVSIRVANTGDDANDGMSQPVKTLKHAIGLALANREIVSIVLASGRYAGDAGETFPYSVPDNLTIAGPAGGGAVLVGTGSEPGLIVSSGKLHDLEFEHFTVAMIGMGVGELTNIRVRSTPLALRGEASSMITANGLDVTGVAGACAWAVELNADATLAVTDFAARTYGVSFHARDQSTLTVSAANIDGDDTCNLATGGVFNVVTTKTFSLTDSIVDGGFNGIYILGSAASTRATISNTTVRNSRDTAIAVSGATLTIAHSEISRGRYGIFINKGVFELSDVVIKQLIAAPFQFGDGMLRMRNSAITDNPSGMYLHGDAVVDLGTAENPGNNVFQNRGTLELEVEAGDSAGLRTNAVGNSWNPNVQGADANGHYTSMLLTGPIPYSIDGNFYLPARWTVQL